LSESGLVQYCVFARKKSVWFVCLVEWAGNRSCLLERCRTGMPIDCIQYPRYNVLTCRLLSSCSSRDHISIDGVVVTVGRWCLLGSVSGNAAVLSGGTVGSSAAGKD